jgi:hypothetical protein
MGVCPSWVDLSNDLLSQTCGWILCISYMLSFVHSARPSLLSNILSHLWHIYIYIYIDEILVGNQIYWTLLPIACN